MSMFEVTVKEVKDRDADGVGYSVERYRQTVDLIDLKAVMAAVNKVPRKPRTKKEQQQAS
jgi:hypothetical protein